MSRRFLVITMFGLLVLAGCVQGSRWRVSDEPTPAEAAVLLEPRGSSSLKRALLGESANIIPIRKRLRPCCAFGSRMGVKLGPLPIPGYQVFNILGPDDVGRHTYDSGMVRLRREGRLDLKLNEEQNGLVYTCRGGFVDIAHVRDYADWMLYVTVQIYAHLLDPEEHPIVLPREGGRPLIRLKLVEEHLVERVGPRRLAIWLARWVVFNMSVWHEIATWFGWSSVPGIPETASAFSPEDLYSNLIGINVAEGVLYRRSARTENLFNRGVDAWLDAVLEVLGALPRDAGLEATRAVEGLWWDPKARLPDKRLVLRRNMDAGDPIAPWLVPADRVPFQLDAAIRRTCRNDRTPLRLVNHAERDGVVYRDWVQLQIEVDDGLAKQEPFATLGRVVTQDDFPAIIEAIREQNREEFGPDSDRPE